MTDAPRILVVEDEPKLAEVLREYLEASHYSVDVRHEGTGVVEAVRNNEPDLMILDIMLPGKDGLSICREVRAFSQVPVIMVTARAEEIDRLIGLELGADDYICKPFSPREVVARVKAILRRSQGAGPDGGNGAPQTPSCDCAGLKIEEEGYQAWYKGENLDLTPAEFRLLLLFTRHPRRAFTREQLLDSLYDDKRIVTDRTVDTHVKNLRRKLMQVGAPSECVSSVYGVGYRFEGL